MNDMYREEDYRDRRNYRDDYRDRRNYRDDYDYKIKKGLTKEIIEEISKQKNDPDWMREIRLKALETYNKLELPTWGPDLSELNNTKIKLDERINEREFGVDYLNQLPEKNKRLIEKLKVV